MDMTECPECGSADTKKARAVRDAGISKGRFAGIGIGGGGLGLGGGGSSSVTKLAESAEQREETFGLMGWFTGFLFLVGIGLSIWIGVMVTEKYEILAGILAGVIGLVIMTYLIQLIAAVLAIIFTATIVLIIASYVGEEYSWWVGGPLGIFLAIGLLSMTWENIKNHFADFFGDASNKEYAKTWICLSCSNRWVQG